MEELIKRLQEASEGSLELDAEIDLIVNRGKPYKPAQFGKFIPDYTTSIDAALTLLLPGWWAEIFAREDQPSVRLHEFQLPCRKIPNGLHIVPAATCALALCAAALRAIEAVKEQDDV